VGQKATAVSRLRALKRMKYVIGKDNKCVGHVLKRRHQFEAFDADDKTLGIFSSEMNAVMAIFTRTDLMNAKSSSAP
jgi:hypothetical protein